MFGWKANWCFYYFKSVILYYVLQSKYDINYRKPFIHKRDVHKSRVAMCQGNIA